MFRLFSYSLLFLVLIGYSCSIIQPYFTNVEVLEQYIEKDSSEDDDETDNELDRKAKPIEASILLNNEFVLYHQDVQPLTHFFDYFLSDLNHIPNVPFPPPDVI